MSPSHPGPSTTSSPSATLALQYFTFFLFGVANLSAWNVWITATSYYRHAFAGSWFNDNFQSYFSITYMCCNLGTMCLMLKWEAKMDHFSRTGLGLALLCGIFILALITSLLPLPPTLAFCITLLFVALSGGASALCAGIFGIVNLYPNILTSALSGGQGFGGLLPVLIDYGLKRGSSWSSQVTAALYFLFGLALCLSALLAFWVVLWRKSTSVDMMCDAYLPAPTSTSEEGQFATTGHISSEAHFKQEEVEHGNAEEKLEDQEGIEEDQELEEEARVSVMAIARGISGHLLAILFNFFITLALFPAISSAISSISILPSPDWFVPLHFLLFNVGDFVGRMLPSFSGGRHLPSAYTLFAISCSRLAFVPLFLLCNVTLLDSSGNPRPLAVPTVFGDIAFFIIVVLFAVSNGWLGTCLLISARTKHASKRIIGDIMVVSLACGLTLGSLLSFGIRAAMCGCNPFIS